MEENMNKKYIVRLTQEERKELKNLVRKNNLKNYRIRHAHVLLAADADGADQEDQQIAMALSIHVRTVEEIRKRFVLEGLESALERKKRATPPRARILDGAGEARLIAMGCSKPPEGRAKWTLKLLAEGLVQLDVVETISDCTVHRVLKKRVEASSAKVLVHPSQAQRRIRCGDGRSSRTLPSTLRSGASSGLHGRATHSTHPRNRRAAPLSPRSS
jgi:hypothetical protein